MTERCIDRVTPEGDHPPEGRLQEEGIVHDDLWVTIREESGDGRTTGTREIERVALVPPTPRPREMASQACGRWEHIRVRYEKPATAFQHPNAAVMLTALQWILRILSKIVGEGSLTAKRPRLLEMYCGCGAHTVPLALSSLLSRIVAVELDDRLVKACRHNCRLNQCLEEEDKEDNGIAGNSRRDHPNSSVPEGRTLVKVCKGDATEWAQKTLRGKRKRCASATGPAADRGDDNDGRHDFDILLVDPPRSGLSPTVCAMALGGAFAHVLYVSCGRRALSRDLTVLCASDAGGGGGFDVAAAAVVDLFPGTEAVESLVHLRRR